MNLLKNMLSFLKAAKKGDMSDFMAENMKDSLEEYNQKGIDFFNNEEIDKAKEQFELVLSVDKNNKDANYFMGKIYFKNDAINDAIDSFLKCLEINPNDIDALEGLSFCYRKSENFDKEKECYETLLELCPNNSYYHFYYGESLVFTADYEKAIQYLNKSKEIIEFENDKGSDIYEYINFYFGFSYFHLKKYDLSKNCFELFLRTNPDDSIAPYYFALCFYCKEDATEQDMKNASIWMKKAIDNGNKDAEKSWNELSLEQYL